jgi:hypothetical protein
MAAQWHAAAERRSIGLIHPTGICLPLIDKLAHDVVVSRRVIAALETARLLRHDGKQKSIC